MDSLPSHTLGLHKLCLFLCLLRGVDKFLFRRIANPAERAKIFFIVCAVTLSFAFIVKESFTQTGTASYYADKFHGKKTYSGEKYDKRVLTGAHLSLPMGTMVQITNLKNDSTVVLKINDRMYSKKRIIDVSRAGAEQLNFIRDGVVDVKLEVVE